MPCTIAASTYFVDGVALPQAYLYLVDATLLVDGPPVLRVEATDTFGNEATTSITVRVDNTAPTVTISLLDHGHGRQPGGRDRAGNARARGPGSQRDGHRSRVRSGCAGAGSG